MLRVVDLSQFEFFSQFKLCAGNTGIHRIISNVAILDYEGVTGCYDNFHTGNFVLTNLLFAKNDPGMIYEAFKALVDIGVAGIAIKDVFYSELPDEVIELADNNRVPIFFFSSIFIEDVLLNITDHLKNSNNYKISEELIHNFFSTNDNKENIYELLNYMGMIHFTHVSTLYISYREFIDDHTQQRQINKVSVQKFDLKYREYVSFTKYKRGILFFYFYSDEDPENLLQNWQTLIKDLEIDTNRFYFGLNDTLLPVLKTDVAIERALNATRYCIRNDLKQVLYSSLRTANFCLDLAKCPYSKEYLNDLYKKILELGPTKGQQLIETLVAYAKCHFQIEKTGEMIFQHPNTVRYRVTKLKNIFDVDDDFSFQVIAMLMLEILETE